MRLPGLLCSLLLLSSTVPATADEPTYNILFNGQSLDGWEGDSRFWSVEDGAIVGRTTDELPAEANTFLIWSGGPVGDFDFRAKVRFEGNNSGVQYRSERVAPDGFALRGFQADLHPKPEYFGMLYGEKTGRGIIAQRGQKVVFSKTVDKATAELPGPRAVLDSAEWNDLRIVAVGNRVVHLVNGEVTVDVTDKSGQMSRSGLLGLQLHRGEPMTVAFRNILLRSVDAEVGKSLIESLTAASSADASKPKEEQNDEDFLSSGPKSTWIWAAKNGAGQKVWLRRAFTLPRKPTASQLYTTCDNRMTLYVNGRKVASSNAWEEPTQREITSFLAEGRNVIAVEGQNDGGVAAFVLKLRVETKDGPPVDLVSDLSWKVAEKPDGKPQSGDYDDSKWTMASKRGVLGDQPWGIPGKSGGSGGAGGSVAALAPNRILTAPGFLLERLHVVTPEQGSWVALTTGPDGSLIASDQGGKGLFRIEVDHNGQTKVTSISTGALKGVSAAQGLLWSHDALWVHRNGGHLLRLTDSDGDGAFDTQETIPSTTGGGEHGNHAVIDTADGRAIYVDGGNHAPLPEHTRSRVPTWDEDLLLPRMWDARGHARGRLAPGGWVTRLDPETLEQEVHAIGFRNQYDITLNAAGDLFTYDADMEWDLGLPWYRPTRICQVTSGADFGWRSGSGKWPSYYEDSLPSVVDIGPGSPTGIISGAGLHAPPKYRTALYALDWTFGTIHAIHLAPDGAGYTGTSEEFVSGTPLPVTDAVVGEDGALYFAVGGRGAQSALFRVRYVGPDADQQVEPAALPEAAQVRRRLERFHGVADPAAVAEAWPHLSSEDRFLRHAARIAVESQPVAEWADRVFEETDPQTLITSAVALARMGTPEYRARLLTALLHLDPASLTESQQLGLLRAYALTLIRLGRPTGAERAALIAELDPLLPSESDDVNTELLRVLTALGSRSVIAKGMALITDREPPQPPEWQTVISRNSRYGGPIRAMLQNPPPTREIGYAFILRNMKNGWTLEQRRDYFRFLNEAAKASGGASYPGYLQRIRDEALGNCTNAERAALTDVTGEDFTPQPNFPVVPLAGPGREWTVETASAAVRGPVDFGRGRNVFYAAKCADCHRLGGYGGDIGPDLTSLPNKFDQRYVIEAIIEPSKHISSQYGSSVVVLEDGRSLTGLVVPTDDERLTLHPNEPDQKPVTFKKSEVEEMLPSKVSQMPKGLLNAMNERELRDLIAFLMSGGNKNDRRYQKK